MSTSEKSPQKPKAEPITRQTKIAEVVDFPLELYAMERARAMQDNPKAGGVPVWLVLVLVVALLGVMGLVIATGPTSVPSLIGIGVLVVALILVLQMRASSSGALAPERIQELEELDRTIKQTFEELGIKCHGCGAAYVETFEQGAKIHNFDADKVVAKLNTLGLDLSKIRHEQPK